MTIKSDEEVKILAQGGKVLAQIVRELALMCAVGVSALELDKYAEKKIREFGGEPSFKGFGSIGQEFPSSLCVSPNDMLVHGIPYKTLKFKDGDLVGLDLGMKYKGLYTDHAVTVGVGNISDEAKKLLKTTKESLNLAIKQAVVGNHLGDIGFAVQNFAEERGYGVVRQLTGHGVGYEVHEEPRVPNYGEKGSGEKIKENAVLAIEPMLNLGDYEIKTADDGWGIITKDGSLAAHFEHTVAVTKNGPIILTK